MEREKQDAERRWNEQKATMDVWNKQIKGKVRNKLITLS